MYGVIYITLGNLSGNAIAFGLYVMEAAGVVGSDSAVRGLAVASLTFACILHALWRKGGIVLNNLLALVKVCMLLAVIVIGFAASAGATFGNVRILRNDISFPTFPISVTNQADFNVNRVLCTGRLLTPTQIPQSPISILTHHSFTLVTMLPTTGTRCYL